MTHFLTTTQVNLMSVSSQPFTRRLRWRSALALLLITACGGGTDAEPDSVADTRPALGPQDVALAAERDLSPGVMLSGSLEPSEVVPINAQVAGTVGGVRVDRGTPVRRGQVLAVIEAAGVRSMAQGAEAAVAAANAAVALADQQLEAAHLLRDAGAMAEIDLRSAQSSAAAARAQLASARAQAASAREDAGRATITAPITGIVSDRMVEPGQPIRIGDPMFTIVNADVLELEGQVPVESAAGVRVGQKVSFTLTGASAEALEGTVARKDPVANPSTRQVGVYVRLPNAGGQITGGQFARGRVVTEVVERAIVVPTAAVRGEDAATYVLVIVSDTLRRRPVTTGARDDATGMIAIAQGLRAGDLVLITPGDRLGDGTAVKRPASAMVTPDTATGGQ
jgi:RND family efflux transporter MFP subunit